MYITLYEYDLEKMLHFNILHKKHVLFKQNSNALFHICYITYNVKYRYNCHWYYIFEVLYKISITNK